MDEREYSEFDLEDIMREFGTEQSEEPIEDIPEEQPEPVSEDAAEQFPEETPEEEPEVELSEEVAQEEQERLITWQPAEKNAPVTENLEQTRRMDPVRIQETVRDISADTIRLDGLRQELSELTGQAQPRQETARDLEDTIRNEPFSEKWEPEYEQPMGEYKPPQPIIFHPRSRLRELKRKLVAGPEKQYYALSEKGLGKLQVAIFISLLVVLIAAASTAMYAFGAVRENRLRLMVFGQFLAMLVSALLGSFQLIEGVTDLIKKKFTLNTMLVVTFLLCCVDGVLCLRQLRVPCCAAFSLAMTMSLWSTYQRRAAELSQMDTMRKAIRLDGVALREDYLDSAKGFVRCEGQVEDFMDHYAQIGKPEKSLQIYGLVATCVGIAIGVAAGVLQSVRAGFSAGISVGIQVAAVTLLAAMPASAFICHSRPKWVLEGKLHKLRTVICGWRGVEGLSGRALMPLTHQDLYPAGSVRMNGMKFFGSRDPEDVIAAAAAVITADNGCLADLFQQILDNHNCRRYAAEKLQYYARGGIGGTVDEEAVLVGSLGFMKEMDIQVPDNAKISQAVYVAVEGELCGLFAMHYEKTKSSAAGLSTLSSYRNLYCVLTSSDFTLTHSVIGNRFGIKTKRLLLPERELRAQLQQKEAAEDAQALLMTTADGLAPVAYGITGARVLKMASKLGTGIHMAGGILGLVIMAALVALGALELLTPANMFLYQLVWLIPGLLVTEWTRAI